MVLIEINECFLNGRKKTTKICLERLNHLKADGKIIFEIGNEGHKFYFLANYHVCFIIRSDS